jgi:hypothetical protein
MSEYADIQIDRLSLYWFRNYLDSDIVGILFSEKDYTEIPNYIVDPDDDECEPITKYEYVTTVQKAKERLDALGYGLAKMESVFNERVHDVIDYDPFLSHLNVNFDDWEEKARERIDKYITFTKWTNSIKKIIKYELTNGNLDEFQKNTQLQLSTESDKVIYYALTNRDRESYYALDTNIMPIGFIFRLLLECCDRNQIITLDFTNLVYWDVDCISRALDATKQIEKTIVLVEGTSDKDMLEFAIKMLYPHLSDLYYFMDFSDGHGNKRSGGASELSKCMEMFYYSKLKAKFIAVFDNDAEGYLNMTRLQKRVNRWPDNFRIMCYPQLKEFASYPTLAPNGKIMNDNINKKACSIELYLPDYIISEEDDFYPIEWEARKKIEISEGQAEFLYQGVISNKETIKDRFHELRKKTEAGNSKFVAEEWHKMCYVLKDIIFAFT